MICRGITFRDLDFDREFCWCREQDGRVVHGWVRIGVPRLAHGMERCVFFAFGKNDSDNSLHGPGGTGFFVVRDSESVPFSFHIYAVINRHVAEGSANTRVNSSDTAPSPYVHYWECDPSDRVFSRTDDLAALDVTD